MLKRILAPLDGSERAERGLAVAARLARGSGSELLIVRIVSVPNIRFAPYGEPAQVALALIAAARQEAEEYLNKVSKNPLLEGISVETCAIEGQVTESILEMALDEHCDLIVICTHGYTGFNRWRLGRVASHVARHAPVPVFIVPARDAQPPEAREPAEISILVTLDGSELAEAAIRPALDVAHAMTTPERISAHLFEVVDFFSALMEEARQETEATSPNMGAEEHALEVARAYLSKQAERIQQEYQGVRVTTTATLASDVARTICEVAEGHPRYSFVAMGTHGRGGLQLWALGSITERVLHTTHLPMLIVRSPVAIEHDKQVAEANGG